MAAEYSFDIVSKPDLQEVKNAVQQTEREVSTRYDFKDSISEVTFDESKFSLKSDDEYRMTALVDVLQSKLVKRGIDLKFLEYGKVEPATKGTVRQEITLKTGLPVEVAKKITKLIKDNAYKVTTQIQDQQVRVTSKSKDDLQQVQNAVKAAELDVPVQFTNYR
ncbi:MAG: YajQ family cyclic di-GMP-binding protein [Capsulimonadaceae bacterium]|nr:YajQ family cyclic di-GMP-binding protein [Capsulimonadaceae bacterium]